MKKRKKKCMNCAFAVARFKLGSITHTHCEYRKMEMLQNNEERNSFETLRSVFETCETFTNKQTKP